MQPLLNCSFARRAVTVLGQSACADKAVNYDMFEINEQTKAILQIWVSQKHP